ncbi:hypothetical protein [Bifidobacterium leontopitheci]|uniref:hypothetical protein n=1 Tax=Bifidobacterium leontopitheci TaxID=2650774 RepID=UPI00126507BB|nr:hypothetical protein [Bifidobacterium leontopitheci]
MMQYHNLHKSPILQSCDTRPWQRIARIVGKWRFLKPLRGHNSSKSAILQSCGTPVYHNLHESPFLATCDTRPEDFGATKRQWRGGAREDVKWMCSVIPDFYRTPPLDRNDGTCGDVDAAVRGWSAAESGEIEV